MWGIRLICRNVVMGLRDLSRNVKMFDHNRMFSPRYPQYFICGKTRGGQQCIFYVFLTKPVGVNENLRGREAQEGGWTLSTNRALYIPQGSL